MSFGSLLGGVAGVLSPTTILGTIGLGAGQSIINDYYNRKSASRQNRYTYGLIDYENEYNLPVNQRARLEEAGYNPNLALSGVNVQSATGSAPDVHAAQIDMLRAYNLEEQNKLLAAQGALARQQAALSQYNTGIAEQNKRKAYAEAVMALYNADYAQAEHDLWEKTGKIPQSYYKPDWSAELTGAVKGLLTK